MMSLTPTGRPWSGPSGLPSPAQIVEGAGLPERVLRVEESERPDLRSVASICSRQAG